MSEPVERAKLAPSLGLDISILAIALLVSAALVWLTLGDVQMVAVFVATVIAIAGVAWAFARLRSPTVVSGFAETDWAITVSAMDRPDMALAITDRAGRMACATPNFEAWFGVEHAPPRLPLKHESLEQLAEVMRKAWRDGQSSAKVMGENSSRWLVDVSRIGRGDDYLVWRVSKLNADDHVQDLIIQLQGDFGRTLGEAGIATAVVDPEGAILSFNDHLAEGQGKQPSDAADLTGTDFLSLISQEDDGRIAWARSGGKGAALVIHHVPIFDPDLEVTPNPETVPSLMMVMDAGQGIGSRGDGDGAVPHLEALLSQLPLGLAMTDRDGRVLFANPAFMRAAGHEGGTPPTYPSDLVVKGDKRALSEAIRRFAQGPAAAGDLAVRLNSQPDESVSISLAGVRGLGEAAVLLGLTDTSEEIRLKRQVAQATKMQAVGQLAGGVAHDFNNVLTAILGTCDLMLMRHTPGDSDYDDIQQIRANSNRAASLTRQLLAFSRQQTLRPEVLQLPDVVADIAQMLRRLIGEKIQLTVRHDRDLGPVRADPTQLEQVIVNLVVNARDAIQSHSAKMGGDGSGQLVLATRKVSTTDVRAMRSEIIPAGEYTALVVEDTGGGIPPDIIGKIFEPFFTTKEQGKGTGLGLSTVYGIVKQSGGFIFAENDQGKGTRFTVYLPVHHIAAGSVPETLEVKPEPAPTQWAGGGSILLVEDEDSVRIVAERALTRQGYQVTCACDGEEGLALVQDGGTFDLVISDVVMPTLDGPAMAREIRRTSPDLPVLFMSGYAEEQLRKQIGLAHAWFMPKPFSVQQLSEKVGEVLSSMATKQP